MPLILRSRTPAALPKTPISIPPNSSDDSTDPNSVSFRTLSPIPPASPSTVQALKGVEMFHGNFVLDKKVCHPFSFCSFEAPALAVETLLDFHHLALSLSHILILPSTNSHDHRFLPNSSKSANTRQTANSHICVVSSLPSFFL